MPCLGLTRNMACAAHSADMTYLSRFIMVVQFQGSNGSKSSRGVYKIPT
jgi:hypothetical protein